MHITGNISLPYIPPLGSRDISCEFIAEFAPDEQGLEAAEEKVKQRRQADKQPFKFGLGRDRTKPLDELRNLIVDGPVDEDSKYDVDCVVVAGRESTEGL